MSALVIDVNDGAPTVRLATLSPNFRYHRPFMVLAPIHLHVDASAASPMSHCLPVLQSGSKQVANETCQGP